MFIKVAWITRLPPTHGRRSDAGRSARVVRSTVASLTGDGVRYRSALSFDEVWETLWEQCTLDGYLVPAVPVAADEYSGQPLPGSIAVTLSVTDGAAK